MEHIQDVLKQVLSELKSLKENQFSQKDALTLEEACKYIGISKSKMYKHTSAGTIPYYKPTGKNIFFKKSELDDWMLRNRQSTNEELEREATLHCFTGNKFNERRRRK
ncbi:helix-turn-helix domain-containing protein [Aestuariibaculum suncheonense]|uniref:Helix-turn-helix domain-containing protein n=1 Tax=Aestuariibaculum suncheonense TaxID=1028745 RepID=A0A8J6Q8U3_9FLAO|nr:helix-turn-helix domain-containing protein [Aestuariibaculum suncheonense]MBD0836528.1 helix-turn-helix domain-containing protein [Aestuariibaculum suncheonense]